MGLSPSPYLSTQLRINLNILVSKVNQIFQDTIQQNYSEQARFTDLDAGFNGHRFCEPGADHGDQINKNTNFDNVYLWNLNWPCEVANTPASNPDEQNGNLSSAEAERYLAFTPTACFHGAR